MTKPLRNPKHEKFVRLLVIEGKDSAAAHVEAGFTPHRANHFRLMRDPRIKERIAELTEERELLARVGRTPASDVINKLEEHGIERVADFYQTGRSGSLVVRDLRSIPVEVALALLNSLHDGFAIGWKDPAG
jgi:hypothetical protein